MVGPRGLADHQDRQRLARPLLRLGAHHRVLADGLHHQVLRGAQVLPGELADRVDVVGRVDEMGQPVLFAEDRRVGRIEAAHHDRHHQHAAGDHQRLVQQAAQERPVDHRQPPDQRRRQYAEQQQVAAQLRAEQRAGLAGVGLEDVLHHHRVDGDAVVVHEIGRCRRAQRNQRQHRFQCRTEGKQRQQQAEGGPEEHPEGGEERRAMQALQGHQCIQRLPGGEVVEQHQRQGKQQHQGCRTDLRDAAFVALGHLRHSSGTMRRKRRPPPRQAAGL
ncbi:hypothetical protein D3C76_798240 [compost metagenome]